MLDDNTDIHPLFHGAPTTTEFKKLRKRIVRDTREAMEQYGMIERGAKWLVCLSGGKDSLSLLHTLHQFQHSAAKKNIRFTLGAVTIDPGTSSYDPSPLKDYLRMLDVPYFYEEQCEYMF